MYFFVEQLVVDTVQGLPEEHQQFIAQTIQTDLNGWRRKVKEISTLSDTFEVAVLDLWYRNSKIAADRGDSLDAHDFAQLFVDNYFVDDSQIDVWGSGALEAARARVAAAQALERKPRQ
jgi:hypothetical protein